MSSYVPHGVCVKEQRGPLKIDRRSSLVKKHHIIFQNAIMRNKSVPRDEEMRLPHSQYNIVSTFDRYTQCSPSWLTAISFITIFGRNLILIRLVLWVMLASGWYCIRASLWAANYQLPKSVTALNNLVRNDAGVLLSCDACMCWEDGKIATFHCSFLANLTMDITAVGTNGTLLINDFIIPCNEAEVSFSAASKTWFVDKALGWTHKSSEHAVSTDLPQEALMVKEFSALVDGVKHGGLTLEEKWPTISRKTQLVIDAVMASIDKGCQPVEVVY